MIAEAPQRQLQGTDQMGIFTWATVKPARHTRVMSRALSSPALTGRGARGVTLYRRDPRRIVPALTRLLADSGTLIRAVCKDRHQSLEPQLGAHLHDREARAMTSQRS